MKEYERGLTFDPKSQQLQVRVLETMINMGKTDDAQKMVDRLLKDDPGDVTARLTNGRLLAIKGNTAEATTVLRQVVKDAPESPQAHFALGQVLRQTGDMAGAKSELQEANRISPNSPMILQALAEVYRDSHDYDTASEYAARLQKLNENNPMAHYLNATIYLGEKNYDKALDELKEAQKSVPNDPILYVNMAFAYAGQKKYADAERMFQTALHFNPAYDGAMANYIAMMFATNEAPKGVALAEQYAAANPKRTTALFIYASALATTKKYDQALAEYQKALQVDPKSAAAYMHIGQVYMATQKVRCGAWMLFRRRWQFNPLPRPLTMPLATFIYRRAI